MSKDYLVMARVLDREWNAYKVQNVWGKSYTGFNEIAIKQAFTEAFMKGFYLKLTKGDE